MLRILLPFSPLSLLHSFFLSPSLFKVLTVIQFTFMYILYAITHNQGRDQGGELYITTQHFNSLLMQSVRVRMATNSTQAGSNRTSTYTAKS